MSVVHYRTYNMLLVAGAILVVIAVRCMQPVGGDDSVGANRIRCMLYETSGKPAAGASVEMRSWRTLQPGDGDEIAEMPERAFVCSTTTDDGGRFFFRNSDSIPAGIYMLKCMSRDRQTGVFIDSVMIDSAFLQSDTWLGIDTPHYTTVLKPAGVIRGILQTAGDSMAPGIAWAAGVDIYDNVGRDGRFIIENVPYGDYRLTIDAVERWNSNMQRSEAQLDITVNPGDTVVAGPLYGLIFNGNGHTEGNCPLNSRWYMTGDTVIIPETSADLMQRNLPFAGWNTAEDGSGAAYKPGDTLVFDSTAIMLHAQWRQSDSYLLTVTVKGNGTVDGTGFVKHGTAHPITATESAGYPFIVWRVIRGSVKIVDSTASTTSVILESGDASVQGIFESITFRKTYESCKSGRGVCVRQAGDGGYIITGGAKPQSDEYNDLCLVKTDVYGNQQWVKTFGGPADDYGRSVAQTDDGGYIVAGFTLSFELRTSSVYLLKITADGNEAWTRTFCGTNDAGAHAVEQLHEGGYIIAGYTRSLNAGNVYDVFVVKTTADGDTVWTRTFGDNYSDYGYAVQQTTDNGFIIAGFTQNSGFSTGVKDIFLIKTDANGNSLWKNTFDEGNDDLAYSVRQTGEGGYIVTGATFSAGTDEWDVFLLKTDAGGEKIWMKKFNRSGFDMGHDVRQTGEGGYIICGKSMFPGTREPAIYLVKTDANGDSLWSKMFPGYCGYSIEQIRDGGYIITGQAIGEEVDNVLLIKTDEFGNVE